MHIFHKWELVAEKIVEGEFRYDSESVIKRGVARVWKCVKCNKEKGCINYDGVDFKKDPLLIKKLSEVS